MSDAEQIQPDPDTQAAALLLLMQSGYVVEVHNLGRDPEDVHEDFYDSVVMRLRSLGWPVHKLLMGDDDDNVRRRYYLAVDAHPALVKGWRRIPVVALWEAGWDLPPSALDDGDEGPDTRCDRPTAD
jgi:hypothetical protein